MNVSAVKLRAAERISTTPECTAATYFPGDTLLPGGDTEYLGGFAIKPTNIYRAADFIVRV